MNELDAELKDYIEDNQDIEKTPYIIKQKEINLLLSMNGFGELGDLFDPSLFSVNKTLTVVKNLCDDRKKLIIFKLYFYYLLFKYSSISFFIYRHPFFQL